MPVRTPYFQVLIEGEDVTSWVSSVSVSEDDQQADSVALTIPDPRLVYGDALIEGSTVTIDMGYAESTGDTGEGHAVVLKAIITKVELSYPESGVPALTLKGEDRSIVMGLQEKNRTWKEKTLAQVVEAIADEHGFGTVVVQLAADAQISKKRQLHQKAKTDLAFLQELAKAHHAKCFVELDAQGEEVLYFIPERRIVSLRRADELVLRYRSDPTSNLITFSPTFDSSYIDRLRVQGDLDENGKPIKTEEKAEVDTVVWALQPELTALASAADRTRIETLYGKGSDRKAALQKKLSKPRPTTGVVARDQGSLDAANDVLESRRLGQSASGSTVGNIWLRAKSNVQVVGVNNRFAGQWYVSSVTHRIDGGGFRSDFKCVR